MHQAEQQVTSPPRGPSEVRLQRGLFIVPEPARAANTERMPRVPFKVQSVFFPVPPACTDPPKMWEEPEGRKGVDNPGGLGLVGGQMSPPRNSSTRARCGVTLTRPGARNGSAGQGPKPAVLRWSLLEARVSAQSSCSSK